MNDVLVAEGGLGAYGLRITGLGDASAWMQALPVSAPALHVEALAEPDVDGSASRLGAEEADIRLVGGGRLRMRRGEPSVRFRFTAIPAADELLHPYLAPAAALTHLWAGREALHAGAFATPAGAVAMLAEKEGGKSTTLARLANEHAVSVLADDLVVIEDRSVLAGPRCLDVRAGDELAYSRDANATVCKVRGGDRVRLTLASARAREPLAATVVLRWGPRVSLETVPPAERPRWLLAQRMYADRVAGDPGTLLDVCALPMFVLARPHGETGLAEAARALADYFG